MSKGSKIEVEADLYVRRTKSCRLVYNRSDLIIAAFWIPVIMVKYRGTAYRSYTQKTTRKPCIDTIITMGQTQFPHQYCPNNKSAEDADRLTNGFRQAHSLFTESLSCMAGKEIG